MAHLDGVYVFVVTMVAKILIAVITLEFDLQHKFIFMWLRTKGCCKDNSVKLVGTLRSCAILIIRIFRHSHRIKKKRHSSASSNQNFPQTFLLYFCTNYSSHFV